ncbi:MAG TPA: hypothetical protein VMS60_05830 [Solirubrobacterales bacterium]|nr:hypothetical protein [Solirubrobacterales bacterium]
MAVVPAGSVGSAISDTAEWLRGAVVSFWNGLDRVWEILADLWPPVAAVIVTVALLRIIRWVLLLWRGRKPRVQISSFAWAKSGDADSESAWVTSLFREQLAALRLDGLDPLPERAPGAPLVEIVEGVGQGVSRDIASAAGRILKAAWPDSAYEVWATLRPREGTGGRISVQLIERRRGNRTLLNVALEEASWESGARAAAMAVAGALYPEVRKRDRGPWTQWKRPVPLTLMNHYHSAREHEEAHRLEQALDAYHSALDEDPLNPNLRLKIAMLQERLELYLDAWVTYEAIVGEANHEVWRGPDRRVYLLALYRLAVMLSNGRVAKQWVKGAASAKDSGNLRNQERHKRREELLIALECDPMFAAGRHLSPNELPDRLKRAASSVITSFRSNFLLSLLRTIDHDATKPQDSLEAFRAETEDTERERRIEAVLQILSLRRLEQLEGWQRTWTRRPEFPRPAIRTSKLLVRTRIAASLESQVRRRFAREQNAAEQDRLIGEIREAHRALTKRWPFPTSWWREAIRHFAPRRYLSNRREDAWQLYYNAACATASLLRDDSVVHSHKEEHRTDGRFRALKAGIGKDDITRQAISLLEEYAHHAGSQRVAAQADWVAIDDADLRGIRGEDEFKLWASHHLPRTLPKGLSSRKADVKRFTLRVMHEGAEVFAAAWRVRASQTCPDASEVARWWRFEAKVWSALGKASREHLSWQERLVWLGLLEEWLGSAEVKRELDFSHEARGTGAADSMSEGLFDALAELAGDPGSNGSGPDRASVLAWADRRARQVRAARENGEDRADESGELRVERERAEALRAAKLWTRLAEALEVELDGSCEADSDEQLRKRMETVRVELSSRPSQEPRSNGRWRLRR